VLECQLLNENFAPKFVAMATFLEGWKKRVIFTTKYVLFGKKIVKIGLVDP